MDEQLKFPVEFDYAFYCSEASLGTIGYDEAYNNFIRVGKGKGLRGSPLSSRDNFIKWCTSWKKTADILEIGPGSSPAFKGDNVRYFDVFDRDGLILRARTYKQPEYDIPQLIHYHSPTGSMNIIDEQFDLIFSSHSLEHQLDFIQHFEQISRLLKPGGIFACIVPDRRFTFDYFRPDSNFMDVIGQKEDRPGAVRHPLRTILEHLFLTTHNDSMKHWLGEHGDASRDFAISKQQIRDYQTHNIYSDAHRWIFTEETFRDLCDSLEQLEYNPLRLIRCYNVPYGGNSFNCILVKNENYIPRL